MIFWAIMAAVPDQKRHGLPISAAHQLMTVHKRAWQLLAWAVQRQCGPRARRPRRQQLKGREETQDHAPSRRGSDSHDPQGGLRGRRASRTSRSTIAPSALPSGQLVEMPRVLGESKHGCFEAGARVAGAECPRIWSPTSTSSTGANGHHFTQRLALGGRARTVT